MKRFSLIISLLLLSLTLLADVNKLMIEFPNTENNVVYQALMQDIQQRGYIVIGELVLACILILTLGVMNTKMNVSPFWNKYFAFRAVVLQLFVITIGVLLYFSIKDLPNAITCIYHPETEIYKQFLNDNK